MVTTNLSTGSTKNIPDKVEFYKGDISCKEVLRKLFNNKFDYVFHLASRLSAKNTHDDIDIDINTNIKGTYYLLEESLKTKVKKFIFTSSMAVYGSTPDKKIREDFSTHPLSVYGITKIASEKYINSFIDQGLPATTLRLFNIYGPRSDINDRKRGMVSIFMSYVANGEPLLTIGPRDRYRDFTYIDNAVEAIYKAAVSENTLNKTYNLCTGVKTTILELQNTIIQEFGHSPKTYPIDEEDQSVNDRLFGIYGDCSRLRRDTGWKATTSLKEGIKKTVSWIKSESE